VYLFDLERKKMESRMRAVDVARVLVGDGKSDTSRGDITSGLFDPQGNLIMDDEVV
jgi:hypothetical protein